MVIIVIIIVFSLYSGAVLLSLPSSTTFSTTMIIPAAYTQPDLQTIKHKKFSYRFG